MQLDLERHPEGGWYRSTWVSEVGLAVPGVGDRPAASLILFLLADGDASAWHLVRFDELWLWHGPDPLVLQLGGSESAPQEGPRRSLTADDPQILVPAGTWQRTLPVRGECLVSCLVSPGFTFDDWRLAD